MKVECMENGVLTVVETAHWGNGLVHGGFTKTENKIVWKYGNDPSHRPVLHLFSGASLVGDVRVDINEETPATHHEEVLEFLKKQKNESFAVVIADPPYNLKNMKRYRAKTWVVGADVRRTSLLKREINRVLKPGGVVIFKHWFDFAPGKKYELVAQVITKYGGYRRITILTVYKKKYDWENKEDGLDGI